MPTEKRETTGARTLGSPSLGAGVAGSVPPEMRGRLKTSCTKSADTAPAAAITAKPKYRSLRSDGERAVNRLRDLGEVPA